MGFATISMRFGTVPLWKHRCSVVITLPVSASEDYSESSVFNLDTFKVRHQINSELLDMVLHSTKFYKFGWPNIPISEDLKLFWTRCNELGYSSDYFSQTLTTAIATGHPGDSKYERHCTKLLWWPGLDKAIKSQVTPPPFLCPWI